MKRTKVVAELSRPSNSLARFYDSGKLPDRYTAVYIKPFYLKNHPALKLFWYRGMSDNPSHPMGIGISGETRYYPLDHKFPPVGGWHDELGKRITFAHLPASVQQAVISDLTSI